jgi:hypothetical protein
MGEEKTRGWRSMANRREGEMISSGSSTKGTGASRSGTGGGGGREGIRWEEMMSRLLSARILWANPCNIFPRYRNLDAREKTTWNIVLDCRIESLRVQSAKLYIRQGKEAQQRGLVYICPPAVDY